MNERFLGGSESFALCYLPTVAVAQPHALIHRDLQRPWPDFPELLGFILSVLCLFLDFKILIPEPYYHFHHGLPPGSGMDTPDWAMDAHG